MQATDRSDAPKRRADDPLRLRVDVYDAVAQAKGYPSRAAQARWHDLAVSSLFRLIAGGNPSAPTAARMAKQAGLPFEALWERVAA